MDLKWCECFGGHLRGRGCSAHTGAAEMPTVRSGPWASTSGSRWGTHACVSTSSVSQGSKNVGAGPHPSPAPGTTVPSLIASSSPLVPSLGAGRVFRQGKILLPASFFKTHLPRILSAKPRKNVWAISAFHPPLGLDELVRNVPGTHEVRSGRGY